mmetsp:Transcript_30559/g.86381  ORF Transcript_30559/g.86381 Transcript_30559/m.86381 type:complete len:244 (+) Transcript_30559:2045-2776(+)
MGREARAVQCSGNRNRCNTERDASQSADWSNLKGCHKLVDVHAVCSVHHPCKGQQHVVCEALGEPKVQQHRHGCIIAILGLVGRHKQVPGMWVRIEKPVDMHLHSKGVADSVHEDLAVDAVPVHGLCVPHREAVAELHDQHPGGKVLITWSGHNGLDPGCLHVRPHFLQSCSLKPHVQLLLDSRLPFIHNLLEIPVRLQPRNDLCQRGKVVQVAPHLMGHTAVLHLENHLLPTQQHCSVDLRH